MSNIFNWIVYFLAVYIQIFDLRSKNADIIFSNNPSLIFLIKGNLDIDSGNFLSFY